MNSPLAFIFLLCSVSVYGQTRQLFPKSVRALNFSKEGEAAFNSETPSLTFFDNLARMETQVIDTTTNGRIDTTYLEEIIRLHANYWYVLESGCSWYCGGRVSKVTASSSLPTQGGFTYNADNAHDLTYKTAWVEGAKGNGIGEFLEYEFETTSSRVHEIKIANGYVKSATAWQNNGRVKKLKLYHNGKPYAILNLKDQRAEQVFKVGPFGFKYEQYDTLGTMKPWTLRFEILEVYPGTKFNDTAITEIHFMGYDYDEH